MISITCKEAKDGFMVSVRGHADYANGDDIVCAAVSILTMTLASRCGDLCDTMSANLNKGNADIAGDYYGLEAYRTVVAGYRLLRDNYPNSIDMSEG